MSERRRIILLIFIMAVTALLVGGIAMTLLYQTAFKEEATRLVETAQSQARLIEAIARFDATYPHDFPGGATAATLIQIRDAHDHYAGFGESGEFILARREGEFMTFLLSHRYSDRELPQPVPFDSERAEPMRRSLSGESGTMVALDYRGVMVLAAFEPVDVLGLGIVAKIDLSEIRAPFIRAGLMALGAGFLVIFIGALLFVRTTSPLLRKLQQAHDELERRVEERTAELQKTHAQLRQSQKMQAVGQLTAGIAHNFNNRLMVISTAIESQLLTGVFDSEQLKLAESSVDQAARMIDQLMLFSHSGSASHFEPSPVWEVLADAMEIGRETFDRKITLVDEIPGDLPMVMGDINQLGQVFLNLLLNARDALEEGSTPSPSIRIEVDMVAIEEEALPTHLASRQRDYIRIQITDDGIGMNEETQQRIFEPFFTTKDVGKGTGLGLATAYAIVSDHQGWIECKSQVGTGTTFSVYLPVTEQEITPANVSVPQAMPRGTETILLIEDEKDLRNQLVSLLEQYGYEVLVAVDGREGWDTFEREWEHVDVVLLDLSLPKVSGQELLARMLRLNPDTRVIVSTGYTRHGADALGARALLKKPYPISKALQAIREVLDGDL